MTVGDCYLYVQEEYWSFSAQSMDSWSDVDTLRRTEPARLRRHAAGAARPRHVPTDRSPGGTMLLPDTALPAGEDRS